MRRSLLLLVALATLPSTYALPPGEFPIALRAVGIAPYARRHPVATGNLSLFLAAWEDSRENPAQPSLWAARVSRTGSLIDPTGLRIAAFDPNSAIGTHLRSVATDGTDFLIAWTDDQNRLTLAKVTADGKVIHSPATGITAAAATIVWIGDSYVVFTTAVSSIPFAGGVLSAAVVDRDGTILLRESVGLRSVRAISASFNQAGGNVLLGWLKVDDASVHVGSIPAQQIKSGTIFPPGDNAPGFGASPIALSIANATADAVMAAWLDVGSEPPAYHAQLLQNNGTPLSDDVVLAVAGQSLPPTVVWNGAEYVVSYVDDQNVGQLRRFSVDGTALTGAAQIVSTDVTGITLGTFPGFDDSIVVWTDHRGAVEQTNANIVTAGTTALRLPLTLLLSASFPDRSDAAVVWRGDHYLAAWRDAFDLTHAMVGRFNADGQPLDGPGISISSGRSAAPPALASNGNTAVVAWLDLDGVASSLVDPTGHSSRLSFGFAGGLPDANWNGQQYLVAWRTPDGQIVGLRISGTGSIIDVQPVTIAPGSGDPLIGWTGNAYVIVYPENPPCFLAVCPPSATLWAQIVSPNLTPIGSRIQLSGAAAGTPVIASGAAGALVVWPLTAGGTTTLQAARVVNGAVIDALNGFPIGAATYATAYATATGWGVVSGPYVWSVSSNGAVSPRVTALGFVPPGVRSSVVLGGPEPLVVYRRDPIGDEQMKQVVARFLITSRRERAARR